MTGKLEVIDMFGVCQNMISSFYNTFLFDYITTKSCVSSLFIFIFLQDLCIYALWDHPEYTEPSLSFMEPNTMVIS